MRNTLEEFLIVIIGAKRVKNIFFLKKLAKMASHNRMNVIKHTIFRFVISGAGEAGAVLYKRTSAVLFDSSAWKYVYPLAGVSYLTTISRQNNFKHYLSSNGI